jgi:putative membrane protein
MTKILIACALSATLLFGCDKDDDDTDPEYNSTDREFVMKASMANTAEIDAGSLASTKATDGGIQDFGEMMVSDHTTAKSQLKDIADDLRLPAPDSLDAEHVALKTLLMSLSGRAFDSAYIHSQVKDHQAAIDLFNTQVQNGRNQRLKDYASGQLPHLQHHLDMADSLAAPY